MPAIERSISLFMRDRLLPCAKLSLPGCDLASASSSASVVGPSAGLTTSRLAAAASGATGAKSFTGSYGSFTYRLGLAACVVLLVKNSV